MTRQQLRPVADFVREGHPPTQGWQYDDLLNWICLAALQHRLITVYGDAHNDTLTGVMIVRPVYKIPPDDDIQTIDPSGDIIHIDLAVASDKPTMQALAQGAIKLLGIRPLVALRKKGKIKVHPTLRVLKALFKQRN